MRSDEVPAVDIDISDPSDDEGDRPVEGSHKVVVSNSQVAHKPDFVDRTAKKRIYINGSSYKNGKIEKISSPSCIPIQPETICKIPMITHYD